MSVNLDSNSSLFINNSAAICSICNETITEINQRIYNVFCGHLLHKDCVEKFFLNSFSTSSCAYCQPVQILNKNKELLEKIGKTSQNILQESGGIKRKREEDARERSEAEEFSSKKQKIEKNLEPLINLPGPLQVNTIILPTLPREIWRYIFFKMFKAEDFITADSLCLALKNILNCRRVSKLHEEILSNDSFSFNLRNYFEAEKININTVISSTVPTLVFSFGYGANYQIEEVNGVGYACNQKEVNVLGYAAKEKLLALIPILLLSSNDPTELATFNDENKSSLDYIIELLNPQLLDWVIKSTQINVFDELSAICGSYDSVIGYLYDKTAHDSKSINLLQACMKVLLDNAGNNQLQCFKLMCNYCVMEPGRYDTPDINEKMANNKKLLFDFLINQLQFLKFDKDKFFEDFFEYPKIFFEAILYEDIQIIQKFLELGGEYQNKLYKLLTEFIHWESPYLKALEFAVDVSNEPIVCLIAEKIIKLASERKDYAIIQNVLDVIEEKFPNVHFRLWHYGL